MLLSRLLNTYSRALCLNNCSEWITSKMLSELTFQKPPCWSMWRSGLSSSFPFPQVILATYKQFHHTSKLLLETWCACLCSGLYFHIGETERKCFIEEISDEGMVTGNYKVHYSKVYTIQYWDFEVTIHSKINVRWYRCLSWCLWGLLAGTARWPLPSSEISSMKHFRSVSPRWK